MSINEQIGFFALFAKYAYNFHSLPNQRDDIPNHYMIDKELTTDNDNVIMVSHHDKVVVWSIRGTIFTVGNIIDDINIMVSGKFTDVFDIFYYQSKLSNIINKYKIKNKGYKIVLASHSLGANKQIYAVSDDTYFVDNVDLIMNYAIGSSPFASSDSKKLFCDGRSDICNAMKNKNFIIGFSTDPITTNIFNEDLSNYATVIKLDISEDLIKMTQEKLSKMGITGRILGNKVTGYLTSSAALYLSSHSIDFFILRFRNDIDAPKLEITKEKEPLMIDDSSYIEPVEVYNPNTPYYLNTPLYDFSQPQIIQAAPAKIIMFNNIIDNNLIDMAQRLRNMAAQDRTRQTNARNMNLTPGVNNPAQSAVTPRKRVQSSPFALPPQSGGVGGGRQGLPMMSQDYLGLPQSIKPQFKTVQQPPMTQLLGPKVKPDFPKTIYKAPTVKPQDMKLKGRPKPNITKMKKQLHELAMQDAIAKNQMTQSMFKPNNENL